MICYFTAFNLENESASAADQADKLIQWYLPLDSEVAAQQVEGRARYRAEAIRERSSTVLTIILGGGLDKITNGFQYVTGNVAIDIQSAFQIFCAAVIFIFLFTLHFGTSEGDKLDSRRALALFFF